MGDLVERWLRDCDRMGKSPRTITTYRERLSVLERDAGGRPIETLTKQDLQRWIDGRGGPASRAAHRSTASSFWRWLVEEHLAEENLAAQCRAPTVRAGRPRPVPPHDLARAVTAASPKMRVMLLLGALAGLRVAEMAALRWEDIDTVRHELHVRKGKGSKDRTIPLAVALETAMLVLGQTRRSAVLEPRDGGHYTSREIGAQIAYHLRAQGVDCTAHQLRHSFATSFYALTRDIHATSQLLGHSSPATTAVYARFDLTAVIRGHLRGLDVA